MAEASDVEAEAAVALVLALTAVVTLAVCADVLALTEATIELEAFERRFAVLPFTDVVPADIAAASDVDAVVTSD